ncbi:MAG: alpha/beta hydrolase [Bacteroidales bacterium]|nr:alpha/beta hydrolase [Bacteroidales bacterium]
MTSLENLQKKYLTVIIKNHSVSYIDEGSINNPTIIFIHGFPLNKEMWNIQITDLKRDYRVIAYDLRGHGGSDEGDNELSIEFFANDLISFMDALKLDKITLCGFSMGGYIALNAVLNYPDRFNAILLCDTGCSNDSPEAKEKRMKSIENIKLNGLEQYADESLKKLFAPISFSKYSKEVSFVKDMIMRTPVKSLFKTLHALANRKETCSKLHEIKVPVLIMVGKEDEITPVEVAMYMHKKIKESIIHIIDHAGHMSNMENSKEFNTQLTKFLLLIKQR